MIINSKFKTRERERKECMCLLEASSGESAIWHTMASKLKIDALNINVCYKPECQTLHSRVKIDAEISPRCVFFFSCWETKIPVSALAIGKWCIKYAHLNINIFTILVLCWGYCTSSHLLFLLILPWSSAFCSLLILGLRDGSEGTWMTLRAIIQ